MQNSFYYVLTQLGDIQMCVTATQNTAEDNKSSVDQSAIDPPPVPAATCSVSYFQQYFQKSIQIQFGHSIYICATKKGCFGWFDAQHSFN